MNSILFQTLIIFQVLKGKAETFTSVLDIGNFEANK